MAPTITTQPTRSSSRIAELKKKAAEASAAVATPKAHTNKRKRGKRGPTKVCNITTSKLKKDVTDISKVTKPTKKATIIRTTKFRFFLTPDQLSDVIIKSHSTNKQLHEWVKGDFSFAAPGEQIPTGSLEVSIKVPSGLEFLVFPKVLKVEGETVEEEMAEEVQAAESTSELSECPYVSDVRVDPMEEEGVDKGRPRWKKARSDLLAWLAQTEEGLSFEKEHHV
jgi:hypothetical protein